MEVEGAFNNVMVAVNKKEETEIVRYAFQICVSNARYVFQCLNPLPFLKFIKNIIRRLKLKVRIKS